MIDGTTRRGLLATLAATGVAGCSGDLPGVDDDREIESRGLPAVDVEDTSFGTTPEFPVSPTFPVSVAAAQFRRHRDRTTALLSELPTPLSAETVPNGHVRAELADAVREATTALADARTAPTERVALRRLRDARVEAGYAAAGWGFATGERELPAARNSFDAVVDEAQEARETLEHVAGDPVVATAGYAAVEYLFTRAGDRDTPNAESTLLRVAETGNGHVRPSRTLATSTTDSPTPGRNDTPTGSGRPPSGCSNSSESGSLRSRPRHPARSGRSRARRSGRSTERCRTARCPSGTPTARRRRC